MTGRFDLVNARLEPCGYLRDGKFDTHVMILSTENLFNPPPSGEIVKAYVEIESEGVSTAIVKHKGEQFSLLEWLGEYRLLSPLELLALQLDTVT